MKETNFKRTVKKVAALGASVSMIGMTLMGAAAAGTGISGLDASLTGYLVKAAGAHSSHGISPSAAKVSTEGSASVNLEKGSTKLNIGDSLVTNVISAKVTDSSPNGGLDSLTDFKYLDNDKDEFDGEFFITMADLAFNMQEDSDFNDDDPQALIKVADGSAMLNFTIDFRDVVPWVDLDDSYIPTPGGELYVLTADTSLNNTFTALEDATQIRLKEGETKDVTLNGKVYTVEAQSIGSSKSILCANGACTDALSDGTSQKTSAGIHIGPDDTIVQDYAGGSRTTTVIAGSQKVVFTSGSALDVNDDNIQDITVTLTNSGTSLSQIILEWKPDEDTFLGLNGDVVWMPELGWVGVGLKGFDTEDLEVTRIKHGSSTYMQMKTNLISSKGVNVDFLYGNGTHFTGIGKDATNLLATSSGSTLEFDSDLHENFVATYKSGEEGESYLMRAKFETQDNTPQADVEYWKDGKWAAAQSNMRDSESLSIGNVDLTVSLVNDTNNNFTVTAGSNVNFNSLITKAGFEYKLPISAAGDIGNEGYLNTTASAATFVLVGREEDRDNNIGSGGGLNTTFAWTSDSENQVSAVTGGGGTDTEIGNSDVFLNYVYSELGTRIEHSKPSGSQNYVEYSYAGEEQYGTVYLVSQGGTTSDGATGTLYIGGPCVNPSAPLPAGYGGDNCVTGFTMGKAIVHLAANGDVTVAGYDSADTEAALTAFKARATTDGMSESTVEVDTATGAVTAVAAAPAAKADAPATE